MPCWHLHRQLAPLTHLDLPVEAHCPGSFFVDSSRLVSYPLPLCLSSLSSRCTAGLLLTLTLCSPSLNRVKLAALPGLRLSNFRHCCTQDLKSRSASFGVSLTLSLSCHTASLFAASFLSAGTACQLERLICIVGTVPGLCSPESTHRDLDQCLCQQCNLWKHSFFMALHDGLDPLCSASAAESIATSSRQSLGRWCSQTFTTCVALNLVSNPEPHRIAHNACCLWLLIDCKFPLAIVGRRDSQTFTSCSSCVASM